MMVSKSS